MSYMVSFRSTEGKPGYHPAENLEEAVRFVERLRNQEQIADARVWRMKEVPLEVKTYYKVEVASSPAEPAPAAAPARADDEAARPEPAAGGEPVTAAAGPNGARFGRFNRGV